MENEIEATPASSPEKMEEKFYLLYRYRKDVPLAHYELTLIIDGLTKIEEQWAEMYDRPYKEDEELKKALYEGLLHRKELKERIIKMQKLLFP